MPKAALTTLGCKVNQFETETMAGLFRKRGYIIVPFDEKADVYVINTCAVTSLGEKKSRQLIRRAHRLNVRAIIAVTGCYAQVAPDEIRAIDGVRVVLGTKERAAIVDHVERAARTTGIFDGTGDIMQAREFEDIPLFGAPYRTRAFLKIEEGCENFCSFCIIPYARGRVRSRPLESVLSEAKKLIAMGFVEIVLTGIHLGCYGRDLASLTLADAVRTVLLLPKLKRLRLGSLESIELSDALLELFVKERRLLRHLHLPLQSGADAILHAMNRNYDTAKFAALIERIKRAVPHIAISTDIIVGFPGETEQLFAESLAFVERMNFARIHVFTYSPRRGTLAADFPAQVTEEVKKERAHRMQLLAFKQSEVFNSSFLGMKMSVLFETDHAGIKDGLTENYIRVYTDAPVQTGEIYEMRLLHIYRDGVWGIIFTK